MLKRQIAIRVDSSLIIGSGHVKRCLTLANELRSLGADIAFICREHPGHLIQNIEEEGYFVHRLSLVSQQLKKSDTSLDPYSSWLGVTEEDDAAETIAFLKQKKYSIEAIQEKKVVSKLYFLIICLD